MQIGLGIGVGARPSPFSLVQQAISTLRRLGATLIGLPDDYGLVLGPDRFVNFNAASGYVLSGGALVCNASAYSTSNITLSGSWESGVAYRVTAVVSAFTSGSFYIQVGGAGATQYTTPVTAVGTYSCLLVANSAQTFANIQAIASGFVGTISSLRVEKIISAQHFVDSTGTQPVTAIGDLVGLTLDRAGTVGVMLVNNSMTLGGAWTKVGGVYYGNTDNGNSIVSHALIVGKAYQLKFDVVGYVSGSVKPYIGLGTPLSSFSANGSYTLSGVCTSNTTLYFLAQSFNGGVTNITVRELTGNHATQATTASKPMVARVPKRLGPNLVSNGGFDSDTAWTKGAGVTISGGVATTTGSASYAIVVAQPSCTVVAGKTYQVRGSVSRTSGQNLAVQFGSQTVLVLGPTGAYSAEVTANNSGGLAVIESNNATWVGSIDNIIVQEVLEWSNALDFDGSNDKLVCSAPQPTTAFTFICAANFVGTANQVLTNSGLNGVGIYRGGGTMTADKSGVGSALAGAFPDGMAVLSVVFGPGSRKMYRNGVLIASDTATVTFSSTGPMNFGASDTGGSPFNGEIVDIAFANTAMTDQDRKTIERAFAQKAGVTL